MRKYRPYRGKRRLFPGLGTFLLLLLVTAGLLLYLQDLRVPVTLESVPDYNGEPYVELDGGQTDFPEADLTAEESFLRYTELDALGRCGPVYVLVAPETMPTAERGEIGMVRPSGWHTVKYDWVDGKYLYNRCHLAAYQLTGENAEVRNLITGTRYLNVEGMLPFENRVARYVRDTGDGVLYRVTPIFRGADLVARGVQMEACSQTPGGLEFNVYCYNVQPGVVIDYGDGTSRAE